MSARTRGLVGGFIRAAYSTCQFEFEFALDLMLDGLDKMRRNF